MNRKGKVTVIVLISTTVLFFALAVVSLFLYQREHSENIRLKEQIGSLNSNLRTTQDKYDASKKTATELQLKLQELKAQINSLTSDMEQEKAGRQDAEAKLEQVRADLEQQRNLRADLEGKLNLAQDEGKKIKDQIKDLEQQKSDLEVKLKEFESAKKVELGKVVVNPDQAIQDRRAKAKADRNKSASAAKDKSEVARRGALEGKVLVVNKEFNFIVFNLGNKDKVSIGDKFGVYHNGVFVGDVQVEKVHESMSAAGFGDDFKNKFFEDDKVVQKAK